MLSTNLIPAVVLRRWGGIAISSYDAFTAGLNSRAWHATSNYVNKWSDVLSVRLQTISTDTTLISYVKPHKKGKTLFIRAGDSQRAGFVFITLENNSCCQQNALIEASYEERATSRNASGLRANFMQRSSTQDVKISAKKKMKNRKSPHE